MSQTPANYTDFYQQSIDQPEAFWAEQANLIEWHKPFDRVCNYEIRRLPSGMKAV